MFGVRRREWEYTVRTLYWVCCCTLCSYFSHCSRTMVWAVKIYLIQFHLIDDAWKMSLQPNMFKETTQNVKVIVFPIVRSSRFSWHIVYFYALSQNDSEENRWNRFCIYICAPLIAGWIQGLSFSVQNYSVLNMLPNICKTGILNLIRKLKNGCA